MSRWRYRQELRQTFYDTNNNGTPNPGDEVITIPDDLNNLIGGILGGLVNGELDGDNNGNNSTKPDGYNDPEIPDTGAESAVPAIATLITSAATAVGSVLFKKKKDGTLFSKGE